MSFLEKLGKQVIYICEQLGDGILLLRETFRQLHKINIGHTIAQMAHLGVDSLPIVSLTLLFAGAVMTLQMVDTLVRYGAQTTIGGIIAVAISRELGPILVGVVLAGRVGAAITAELGSMRVTEQIDALRVMATDPIGYLVVPRFVACVMMVPILAFYGVLIGIAGGYVVALMNDIPGHVYTQSIKVFAVLTDLLFGLVKAGVFGGVIALVGCYKGMHTEVGAAGVGRATTSSVVTSIVLIFVLNYFLSMILF